MALAECLLYEGRSLESARGPQSFRTIPSRQLLTGEPCAGEPHARFGGRGVRLNRTSLPLLCWPNFPTKSRMYRVFKDGEHKVVTTFQFGLFWAGGA